MVDEKLFCKYVRIADRALKSRGKKVDAVNKLMEDGVLGIDANEIVDRIISENVSANRDFGLKMLVLGVVGLIVSIGIFIIADRLYYIILVLSAFSALGGLAEFVWPTSYKMRMSFSEDA